MFRSLFDYLQAEYTILIFGNDYTYNGSVVVYSIFHIVLGLTVCLYMAKSCRCQFCSTCVMDVRDKLYTFRSYSVYITHGYDMHQ
jgi:hypothetical protein